MNVILAINEKTIEKYIASLNGINVLRILKNKKYIVRETMEYNPHAILLSSAMPGKEKTEDIIRELREKQQETRIIFLYGNDDEHRADFEDFLSINGIYDFHVGYIDEDIINELLFSPKSPKEFRRKALNIKENISEDNWSPEISNAMKTVRYEDIDYCAEKYNEDSKEIIKELEVRIIERVEEIETEKIITKQEVKYIDKLVEVMEQGVITLFSKAPTGKSFLGAVLGQALIERGYIVNIICLDKFSSINCYLNLNEDNKSNINRKIKKCVANDVLEEGKTEISGLSVLSAKTNESLIINGKELSKLIDVSRSKFDITIIDTGAYDNELAETALSLSNINLFIFDTNKINYLVNLASLNELEDEGLINYKKTIAVINNYNDSESLKKVTKDLLKLNKGFKDLVRIMNLSSVNEIMNFQGTPYYLQDKAFKEEISEVLQKINSRSEKASVRNGFNGIINELEEFIFKILANKITYILLAAFLIMLNLF